MILKNITGEIPTSHENGMLYIDQNTHVLVQVNRTVNNRMFLYKNIAASLSCKVSIKTKIMREKKSGISYTS